MSIDHGSAIAAFAGRGGIDYDLLAAALLRQRVSGDGFPVGGRGEKEGVEQSAVTAVQTKKSGGSSGSGVGVTSIVGEDRGVEVAVSEDSFGAIPQSDEFGTDPDSSAVSVHSASSVSGGVPGQVSDDVRNGVKFGGIVDVYGDGGRPADGSATGFCALTSRRPQTKELAESLKAIMGVKVPKAAMIELGMCTYTAGSMPDIVVDGAAKLRSLAAIGDAAVTLHVTASFYSTGKTVRSAQAARSKLTSDVNMGVVMRRTGLYKFVSYPPGVDPFTSSATATAFEAIVGVLVLYRSFEDVKHFLSKVGIAHFT